MKSVYRQLDVNNVRWSFNITGNGCIAHVIVSPSGCRPANMTSTISSASSVMRSTRLMLHG